MRGRGFEQVSVTQVRSTVGVEENCTKKMSHNLEGRNIITVTITPGPKTPSNNTYNTKCKHDDDADDGKAQEKEAEAEAMDEEVTEDKAQCILDTKAKLKHANMWQSRGLSFSSSDSQEGGYTH
jgi:hypothetical protein